MTFADIDDKTVRTDGCLQAECSTLKQNQQPFLIIEVANTQTELDVIVKGREYVESAHGRISIVVILKIDPKPECTTRLWIWKAQRHSRPTEKHPEGFITTYKPLIGELEIYPNFESTNPVFELTTEDLFPQHEWVDQELTIRCDLTKSIKHLRQKIESHKRGDLIKDDSSE